MRIVDVENSYISPIDKYGKITNEQIMIYARCISDSSIITLPGGKIILRDIKNKGRFEILSYNLSKGILEKDYATKINSNKKVVYEIETENGKKIRASKDHIFFVYRNKKIIEVKLEDLNEKDKIVVTS